MKETVAVVKWSDHDEIATAIHDELINLGYQAVYFRFDEAIPDNADIVFSFAPYGRFLPIPRQLASTPAEKRPIFVHWNTENPPCLRIPWFLIGTIGAFRSWVDRLNDSCNHWIRVLASKPPLSWINKRMLRFRYVGDYRYAYHKGWLDILVESSEIYTRLHSRHGLPAIFVPWGTSRNWYANLNLKRDIDVLWMGQRRNKRRSKLLDQVRQQLSACGVKMYVADNIENPFIFGEVRTQFLNRAKITLNLQTSWYDNIFPYRFHMAAGNRSLVVSELFLSHCSVYTAGTDYVSVPANNLVMTLLYYLEHDDKRFQIIENAYQLVTTELTFTNSIKAILEAVDKVRLAASTGNNITP